MFCSKCGNQINDKAAFCPKCGNQIKSTPGNGQKKIVYNKKVVLLIVLVICGGIAVVNLISKAGDKTGFNDYENQGQNQELQKLEQTENLPELDYNITKLEVDKDTVLTGIYPYLTEIVSTAGDITLDGGFPLLTSITMNADENGNIGLFEFTDNASFPKLEVMYLNIQNKHLNEDFKELLTYTLAMRDNGLLDKMVPNIMYDITDLYGTWISEDGTFALTLSSDGKVRVADASNLLGVDVLSYREIDKDTLGLKAEGNNIILNMVEITMDYQLLGNELTVEFLEYEFVLIRED